MATPFLTSTKRKPSPAAPLPPAKKPTPQWPYDPNDAQTLELQTFLKNGGILTPSSSIHQYNSTQSSHGINSFISAPLSPAHDEERYNSLLEADLLVAVAASNRSPDEPDSIDPDLTHDDALEGYVKDLLLNIPIHSANTTATLPIVAAPPPPRTSNRKTTRKGKSVAKKDRDGDYEFDNFDGNGGIDPELESRTTAAIKEAVGGEADLLVATGISATERFDTGFPPHSSLDSHTISAQLRQPHASTSAAVSLPASGSHSPPLHPLAGAMTAKQTARSFTGTELVQMPCPWTDCDKSFARKSDFLRHYRIHTGERPFVCEEPGCGKDFIQRSALTVHLRVHSGAKPHTCPECSRPFGDSSSLARHRKVHEGLKPFKCEKCGKKEFNRKATLSRHEVICKGMDGKSKAKSATAKSKSKGPAAVVEDSDAYIVVGGEGTLEGNAVASGSGIIAPREEEFGTSVGVRGKELDVGEDVADGGRGFAGVGRGGSTRAASAGRNPVAANAALPRRTNLRARVQRSTVQRVGSGEPVETDLEEDEYFDELAPSDEEDDYDEYLDSENATGSVWHDMPIRRPSVSNRLVQQSTSSHSSTSTGPVLLLLPAASPIAGANGTSATRTEVHPIPHPSAVVSNAIVENLQASIPIPASSPSGIVRGGTMSNAGRKRTNGRATSAAMMANNIRDEEFFKTFIESDPIEEPVTPAPEETIARPGSAAAGVEGVVLDGEAGTAKVVSAEETAISTLIGGFGE